MQLLIPSTKRPEFLRRLYPENTRLAAQRLLQQYLIGLTSFQVSQSPPRAACVTARKVFDLLASHRSRAWPFDAVHCEFSGPVRDSIEKRTNYLATWKEPADFQSDWQPNP
jgi:hypothetical protein